MKRPLAWLLSLNLLVCPLLASGQSTSNLRLWYAQPANPRVWEEALPIGSGRMGAMVFGGVVDERIQFNEDTLWTGKPHDYVRDGAGDHLAEIRRLIFQGQSQQAGQLLRPFFLSNPVRQKAYQPFGDIRLNSPTHKGATAYRRELNLDSAVATVSYHVGDVTHTREVFASYPDNVIVVHLTADKPNQISFAVRMDSPHRMSQTKTLGTNTLSLAGQVLDPVAGNSPGLRFESRLRVLNEGGGISASNNTVTVENADSATLLLVAATSYVDFQDITADPAARCESLLRRIGNKDFASLHADHVADHEKLFRRVKLDLGASAAADQPTGRRLDHFNDAVNSAEKSQGDVTAALSADPSLAVLYFQMGRYMLIASSRPGTQPANLQGVWNELLDPPWESKYTTNINFEMNYWPAELTNLSECHQPLFDMVDDLRISGARTAQKMYGARGWVLHHNTDQWRGTAPINNIDGMWPTGTAWLCHHLWEHYLYTGDKEFLARRAYPAMKEASLFFVDSLVKDPRTGYLVTNPTHSPEQGPLTYGTAMDMQLIRALFDYTTEAAAILGVDEDFVTQLADVRKRLVPDQIGQQGQLQEWMRDVDQPDDNHRHMSPLWGLYPGQRFTRDDAKLFDAAKLLLKWRGDGSTGWSYAWRMGLWARAYDGDFAARQLCLQLAHKTFPNLFDKCGPFQVDGNFGATAGIAEMLLQSHLRVPSTSTHVIDLLPALPKAWPTGSVTGLCVRGGFELDIAWDNGKLRSATIRSNLGNACQIRSGDRVIDLRTETGRSYSFDGELKQKE